MDRRVVKPDHVYSSGAVILSGAFAGIAALAVTYPLECSKTKMQVQPHRFKTLGGTLYQTYRQLGVPGLYTGFHASSLQVGGKVALNFLVFENAKRSLEPWLGKSSLTCLAAGMASGALDAVLCTTPTERIKVLQIQASSSLQGLQGLQRMSGIAASATLPPRGFTESLSREVEMHGVATLWRGVGPTLFKQVSVIGFRFASFGILKDFLSDGREPQPWHSLAAGGVVGGMSVVFSQPIDTVKSRMQADHGTTVRATIRALALSNGWGGFMHGITPRFTSTSISMAITFTLYDSIRAPIDYLLTDAVSLSCSAVHWLLSPPPLASCESSKAS